MAEDRVIPLIIGMWLPNIIFLYITFVIFRRVEREKPIISEWVQNRLYDRYEKYILPVIQLGVRLIRLSLRWRPGHSDYTTVYYPDEMKIHASSKDKIYHVQGCEYYDCPQCTIQFKDAAVAEAAGFSPCKLCSEE